MSRDKHPDPNEDLDLDFASFDLDGPQPAGSPDPFELEAMPGPAVTKPTRATPSPRDHFGDIDGSDLGAGERAAASSDEPGEFDGFGSDDFGIPPEEEPEPEPAPAARPRANLRKEEAPSRRVAEPHFDDGFGASGFEAEDAEPRAALGFDDEGEGHGHDDGDGHDARHGDHDGHDGADDEGSEGDEGDDEAPARRSFEPKKFIFPAAAAAVALFAGVMSWNFLGDMISGPETPRAGGALSQMGGPAAPRPAQQGGLAPLASSGGPSNALPPMPQSPNRVAPSAPPSQQASLPPMPVPGGAPSAAPAAAAVNTAPAQVGAVASRPDPEMASRLDQLERRIQQAAAQPGMAELQQKVRILEERLAATESREIPQAPKPDVVVPLKPQLIPGYTLQGYFKGTAWIQTPDGGTVEARIGSDLGAAGTVTGVARYAKEFVVTTSVGVIMRN